jgi:hypothetical protein
MVCCIRARDLEFTRVYINGLDYTGKDSGMVYPEKCLSLMRNSLPAEVAEEQHLHEITISFRLSLTTVVS